MSDWLLFLTGGAIGGLVTFALVRLRMIR